jgi:hypothetical protein
MDDILFDFTSLNRFWIIWKKNQTVWGPPISGIAERRHSDRTQCQTTAAVPTRSFCVAVHRLQPLFKRVGARANPCFLPPRLAHHHLCSTAATLLAVVEPPCTTCSGLCLVKPPPPQASPEHRPAPKPNHRLPQPWATPSSTSCADWCTPPRTTLL